MRIYINWNEKQETIFEMLSQGKSIRETAQAVGVKYNALSAWWALKRNRGAYEIWLTKTGRDDNRRKCLHIEKTHTEMYHPKCQNKRDVFRSEIYVGKRIKNHRNGESGVVVAVYPHVFTMRTTSGFLSSYTYNCFMDFEKKEEFEYG